MELLTVQETAKLLKLSPITIRRYIGSGRLPAVRIGRAIRVRREAVEELLEPVEPTPDAQADDDISFRPFTMEDSLWNIVGIGDSGPDGPRDVATNKHKYLADAYADLHEE
jgi:excisionase family DNA binding protein